MIRLFTAIELPEELRRRMASLCAGVDKAKWVAEENLHVTLRFIGNVSEDVAHDILPALGAVRGRPFTVTLAGAGHFGSRRHVRTLWLGIERCPELGALYGRIDSALVRTGLEPEGRKFSPHVTLGRLKNGAPHEMRGWLAANTMFRSMPFTVDRFVLYSSFLGRNGSIYTPEQTFPLDRA